MSGKRAKPPPKPGKPLEEALRALVAGLDALARPSMIIGGIARGVTRLTRDIDATVAGAGTDLEGSLGILARHAIVPRVEDAFWHVVGTCRYEPGELDPYLPDLRVPDDAPLFTLPAAEPTEG